MTTGPSGCPFNSSYRNRDSLEYKQELGNAIANLARIVPDGLLIFFPSYYLLDQCIGCWKNMSHAHSTNSSTIWERICKHKHPVIEPKQSSLFSSSIEDFMNKLNDTSTSGAVFFAVCRGKVSEGLDFADHAGRAVVVTGIPFAARNDPKVRLKREYLDQLPQSQKNVCKVLTGEEWYSQQASRAVNQAVGRVIRHRHDYGAIIFCDERFVHSNQQRQMSLWLQPHVKCYSKFGEVVFTLTRFFRETTTSGFTKLKLMEIANSESSNKMKIEPQDNFLFTESTTNLNNSTGDDLSKKPLSSVLTASKRDNCSQLGDILPANRANGTPEKYNHTWISKNSRAVFGKEKKCLTSNLKNKELKFKNSEIINLTGNSQWDEQPVELVSAVSSKRPKLLNINTEAMLHSKDQSSQEQLYDEKNPHLSSSSLPDLSVKHEKGALICEPAKVCLDESSKNVHHAKDGPVMALEVDVKNKSSASSLVLVPCDVETRGSSFLIQVQEKLSATEYKEFVDYMKALKSKTMKINQVLQSIAGLFSSPERHFLLKRFKDFVPVQYHAMYEQHLVTHNATANS